MESNPTIVDAAIELAARWHAGQRRLNPVCGHYLPYVAHPIEVMKRVWTWGCGDPVILAAAALHDTREDSCIPASEIEAHCGKEVLKIVEELTLPRKADKAAYLADFADPEKKSIRALIIKLADRWHNVNDFVSAGSTGHALNYLRTAEPLLRGLLTRLADIDATYLDLKGIGVTNEIRVNYEVAFGVALVGPPNPVNVIFPSSPQFTTQTQA